MFNIVMSDNISGPNYTETATQSETLIRLTVHHFFCLKVFFLPSDVVIGDIFRHI